jgi:hypothetical protein
VKLRLGKLTKPPEQFGILPSMGTAGLLGMLSQYDELVHRNFHDTRHEADLIERIGGEALASHPSITVRRRACYQCPIGCTSDTELVDGAGAVVGRGEGPEFETVAMFGANLDIYDLDRPGASVCNRLASIRSRRGQHRRAWRSPSRRRRRPSHSDGERAVMAAAGSPSVAPAPGGPDPDRFRAGGSARARRWCARWRGETASAARWHRAPPRRGTMAIPKSAMR